MTASTHVRLISALVAAFGISIVLWCAVVFRWNIALLCFLVPCDSDVRVIGQLSGAGVSEELRCQMEIVEPQQGVTGIHPVVVERDLDGRFDTMLPANPRRDKNRVVISCPGGRTFSSPEFSLHELAANSGRLELGVVSLSQGATQ